MQNPVTDTDGARLRRFTTRVLKDLDALERLLDADLLESDVRRIGAEQEMFLVDDHGRPAPVAEEILSEMDDPRATWELGRYNLELNLEPIPYGGDCFSQLETAVTELLESVHEVARRHGATPLLVGILPTMRKSDLSLENMSPPERYANLNEALNRLREGQPYRFYIKGVDELLVEHDSVMVESANTSFQIHFQVGRDEFSHLYNITQAVAGPVLSAATYSPVLFGRRLWHETRIALFQQSIDTRKPPPHLRESRARVHFGRRWVDESVLQIYREDVANFPVILTAEVDEDPMAVLDEGGVPDLEALQFFNGTVYRWNRACYGKLDGKPHLRIENRIFPSGPTVADEVANGAFWLGLLSALSRRHADIRDVMEFEDVRRNFLAAAQHGLEAQLTWIDGETYGAPELAAERLIPLAREGLAASAVSDADADRYLGLIRERVETRRTGSRWILESLAGMDEDATLDERMTAVTISALERTGSGDPVHTWEPAELDEGGPWPAAFRRVEQYMTTDPVTVHGDEPVDLVLRLMDWNDVHHVPVEDADHRLLGLVTERSLTRFLAEQAREGENGTVAVSEMMDESPVCVAPETSTLDAIRLMQDHEMGCLPVVTDGRLVGLVEVTHILTVAAALLRREEGTAPRDESEGKDT